MLHRDRILNEIYTDYQRTRYFGYIVGADTVILRQYGATEEQINSFVVKKQYMIPDELINAFNVGYRFGITDLTFYDDPCYNAYKAYLKSLVTENAYILQPLS
jgi:hypothetical protein